MYCKYQYRSKGSEEKLMKFEKKNIGWYIDGTETRRILSWHPWEKAICSKYQTPNICQKTTTAILAEKLFNSFWNDQLILSFFSEGFSVLVHSVWC